MFLLYCFSLTFYIFCHSVKQSEVNVQRNTRIREAEAWGRLVGEASWRGVS